MPATARGRARIATGTRPSRACRRSPDGYLLERERPVLVTWAADGGLRMFTFGDRPLAARLAPDAGLAFAGSSPDADAPRAVAFRADSGGAITGFDWAADDGARHYSAALPDHGYLPRELSFEHGNISLSGTLFEPRSGGPHPLAVLIHGSGASDRDNFWYMSIADGLASRGVAVVLHDKRGSGKSGGDWRTASFDTLAGDAAAGMAAARRALRSDAAAAGVVGLSQGGRIAPMVQA